MKKIILFFLVIFISQASKGQMSYFNYLDSTVEWKYHAQYWDGVSSHSSYETDYFDGDTLINGNYYYKKYAIGIDSTIYSSFGPPSVRNYSYGPSFMREDNTLKFWNYSTSTNTEAVSWDSQKILNLQVNDTFPVAGATCTVYKINTLLLGTRALKECHSNLTFTPNSIVEGIGQLGPLCSLTVEGGGVMSCFKKQNDVLQFTNTSCNAFPVPQRHNTPTSIESINVNKEIKIYPNPFDDNTTFIIQSIKANEKYSFELVDVLGKQVRSLNEINSKQFQISRDGLQNGIYFYKMYSSENIIGIGKLVIK